MQHACWTGLRSDSHGRVAWGKRDEPRGDEGGGEGRVHARGGLLPRANHGRYERGPVTFVHTHHRTPHTSTQIAMCRSLVGREYPRGGIRGLIPGATWLGRGLARVKCRWTTNHTMGLLPPASSSVAQRTAQAQMTEKNYYGFHTPRLPARQTPLHACFSRIPSSNPRTCLCQRQSRPRRCSPFPQAARAARSASSHAARAQTPCVGRATSALVLVI